MKESKAKLSNLIVQISKLEKMNHGNPEFSVWHKGVQRTLKAIFGPEDDRVKQFLDIRFGLRVITTNTPDSEFQDAYLKGLKNAELLLKDFVTEIPENIDSNPRIPTQSKLGEDVFIVHGHDSDAKQETARLIEKLDCNSVILHERPNRGRTIIEKLIDESETAGFAIILLTPDDKAKTSEGDVFEPRARQNVILELGYFLAKLGRARVCVLLKGSTSIPSDFNGVLYITMDEKGKWKFDLAKELEEAGFDIDYSKII